MTRKKRGKTKADQYGPGPQDRKLWAEYVRDIHPLDPDSLPDPAQIRGEAEHAGSDMNDTAKACPEPQQAQKPTVSRTGPVQSQSGQTQLDRRTDDKLRRGKLPIEARLDLHGMTREAARHALAQFLRESYDGGKRCVMVITGKGALGVDRDNHAHEDQTAPGVLRRSVPEWLAAPPLSDIVIRHYPARARDGGDGALYVLLKRRRQS
jgi:DNA-nicking Smr family endonuclease